MPNKPPELNPLYLDRMKKQRRTLGLLKFERSGDRNYSMWERKTENLVIDCFGQKSNQLLQFQKLTNRFRSTFDGINAQQLKQYMRDLLTIFVEELQIKIPEITKSSVPNAPKNVNKISQIVEVSVKINLDQTINSIVEEIRANEPDPERVKEAEIQLEEFKQEIKKESPQWSKIKNTLVWALGFSKDIFLKILPILLEKYTSSGR